MKIVINGKRYDTGKMIELVGRQNRESEGTGVTLLGIWQAPRSKTIIYVTDSIWGSSRNDGTCVGIQGRELDSEDVGRLAKRYSELAPLLPEAE